MRKCTLAAIGTIALYAIMLLLFFALPADSLLRSDRSTIFAILVLPAGGAGLAIVLADRDIQAKTHVSEAKRARILGGVILVCAVGFYLFMGAVDLFHQNFPRLH